MVDRFPLTQEQLDELAAVFYFLEERAMVILHKGDFVEKYYKENMPEHDDFHLARKMYFQAVEDELEEPVEDSRMWARKWAEWFTGENKEPGRNDG